MATMAADFDWVDRVRASAAQAAASPAIWIVFPARIERRRKIFRWGSAVEVFMFATTVIAAILEADWCLALLFSAIQGEVRRSPLGCLLAPSLDFPSNSLKSRLDTFLDWLCRIAPCVAFDRDCIVLQKGERSFTITHGLFVVWATLLRVISHCVKTVHRTFQGEGILWSRSCCLIKISSSLLCPLLAICPVLFCPSQIDQSH